MTYRGTRGPWRLRTTARRSRTQWRLLLVVTAVAVLACTAVSTLSLLVTATEERAVRSALTTAAADSRALTVHVTTLSAPVTAVRDAVDDAVTDVLGPAARVDGTGMAVSAIHEVPRPGRAPAITYYGELDDVAAHTRLVAGRWPDPAPDATADEVIVPVAVPQAGAEAFDLALGDLLTTTPYYGGGTYRAEIVGIYAATGVETPYWAPDPMDGAGTDPAFPVPGSGGRVTAPALGPLVPGDGTLDVLGWDVDRLVVRYLPDFAAVEVADIAGLVGALDGLDGDLPVAVGDVGVSVRSVTVLDTTVREVASGLLVTRATVVVVSLLLLVLAASTLLQTARLLAEARAREHHLMRARGASGRQLLGLAGLEAAGLVLVTAVAGAQLARVVYLLVARDPAMTAAGMRVDPGVPPVTWATALGVAAVLGLALTSPLLRRAGTFVEGEQAAARPGRRAMWQRSGLDLVLLALAGVAYWQLRSYRSPLGAGTSLRLNPVLAAGPALALLAGALLCVRLIPAVSRLAEHIGTHGRGVVVPLASWEVGRRAHRATAAVLLLTLALAVGTFGQSFWSTWRQSQADQAAFTLGAPVVVEANAHPSAQAVSLAAALDADDAVGPAPVLRRTGAVADADRLARGRTADGTTAQVLGLTTAARDMLGTGRLAEEGGAAVARALATAVAPVSGIELTGRPAGISAALQVSLDLAGVDYTLLGLSAIARAVVEDGHGLISTLDLGAVPVDGTPHEVRGLFTTEDAGVAGRRVVGLQVVVFVSDRELGGPGGAVAEVLLTDLAVLVPAPADASTDALGSGSGADAAPDVGIEPGPDHGPRYDAVPIEVGAVDWYAVANDAVPLSVTPPGPDQVALRFEARGFGGSVTPAVAQIGWPQVLDPPVVLTSTLARRTGAEVGDTVALLVDGSATRVKVAAVVPRIPTVGSSPAVVVDHTLLARALAQGGVTGSAVDQWWVDPGAGQAEDYLAALATTGTSTGAAPGTTDTATATSQPTLTRQLQEHPLRVATQGALLLVTLTAGALAAVGFAVHAATTLRARELELAQLRAVGLSRGRLAGVVGIESLLLGTLGTVFGVGLGVLLGRLVGPLVAVSSDGSPPVPAVRVLLPWDDVAVLALVVLAVLGLVVLAVGLSQRAAQPAAVLRRGAER